MPPSPKATRRKRRKIKDVEDEEANMAYTTMLTILVSICTQCLISNTNDRGEEVHRVRKDLMHDVIAPLGNTFFRRAEERPRETVLPC